MNQKEAIEKALDLMETAEAAYLSTVDDSGYPQTRAMLNLRNAEKYPVLEKVFQEHLHDFLVYFTTNTSSEKMVQIAHDPRVSVYYSIPGEWRGLMLGGRVSVVRDMDVKKSLWQPAWEMYYHGGPPDPDYTILSLAPTIAKLYHQMHFVTITFSQAG